jgi:hypothetical protein
MKKPRSRPRKPKVSKVSAKLQWFWQDDWLALLPIIHANQLSMLVMLRSLMTQEAKMAIDLAAVTAEVAKNTTVTGSVVTLLQQLTALIQAIPPSTDPVTQAALDDLVAKLTANDQTVADAVAANTPAMQARGPKR